MDENANEAFDQPITLPPLYAWAKSETANIDTFKELRKQDSNFKVVAGSLTPLQLLILHKKFEVIKCLMLDFPDDFEKMKFYQSHQEKGLQRYSPFFYSALNDMFDARITNDHEPQKLTEAYNEFFEFFIKEDLLNVDESFNFDNGNIDTLLKLAIYFLLPKIVELLLQHGAKIKLICQDRVIDHLAYALSPACYHLYDIEFYIKSLLQHGAEIPDNLHVPSSEHHDLNGVDLGNGRKFLASDGGDGDTMLFIRKCQSKQKILISALHSKDWVNINTLLQDENAAYFINCKNKNESHSFLGKLISLAPTFQEGSNDFNQSQQILKTCKSLLPESAYKRAKKIVALNDSNKKGKREGDDEEKSAKKHKSSPSSVGPSIWNTENPNNTENPSMTENQNSASSSSSINSNPSG